MAKELPYFKFHISEWRDGKITDCSMEAQGLFINVCALYWGRLGDLDEATALRKLCDRNATAYKELKRSQILKVSDGRIFIDFLDEQLKERDRASIKNRENALKRWKIDATAMRPYSDGNATAMPIREEKKREEKEQDKIEKTREWFYACIDEITKETLAMTHKGKNIDQAVAESWVFLSADKNRLRNTDSSDVKKLVNTWLGNMKVGQTAKQKPDIKKFLADA